MPRRSIIRLGKASQPLRLMPIMEGSDEKEPILWQIGTLGKLMEHHIDNNKYGVTRGYLYGYLLRYDASFRKLGIWGHIVHEKMFLALNTDFHVILNMMKDLRRKRIITGSMVMDAVNHFLKYCMHNNPKMGYWMKVGEFIYAFYGYDAVFVRFCAHRYPGVATTLNTVLSVLDIKK